MTVMLFSAPINGKSRAVCSCNYFAVYRALNALQKLFAPLVICLDSGVALSGVINGFHAHATSIKIIAWL